MDMPRLSRDQLVDVLAADLPSAELFDILSEYEDHAGLLFSPAGIAGDPELLSFFYSAFLIAHLLIDEVYVSGWACVKRASADRSRFAATRRGS